ncbi:hypothetical protein BDV93DRAFT_450833 [Ceratobasidium sp. AG-I]|nr:hypothetical protein BDV93DRAFT_450833 [Ceratobasidium sp. AG-I]
MSLFDFGAATLCLGSSAYLYLLHHRRNPPRSLGPAAGYVLTNQVVHARLLPAASKHAFTYPTLVLLLSLSALEEGELNCGWRGVVFGYPGIWGRICGLRPGPYLRDHSSSSSDNVAGTGPGSTIRAKLVDLLRPSGVQLGEVWMMTMPSFLGFEGINPLTVYFCYEEGREDVWGVVLEVHNTFGERHAYVLKVGKGEDGGEKRMKGYQHQWTFPRQFHVSPFNDRSGHYVCSVVLPSHPPPSSTSSKQISTNPPRPIINLHLLTAPPDPQLKLTALLRPVLSEPLSARTLLGALVLPPFTSTSPPTSAPSSPTPKPASWSSLPLGAALLLTAARIVYHAGLLHYKRGLAVFARPEPTAGIGRDWVEKALGGVWNDVQPRERTTGEDAEVGGAIGWQTESGGERWARERFEQVFGKEAERRGVSLKLACVDPSVPIRFIGAKEGKELVLCYRSPRTWTAVLVAPSAKEALEVGSRAEKWFAVSDEGLFVELWDASPPPRDRPSNLVIQTVQSIRTRLSPFSQPKPARFHPLDTPASISLLLHVCLLYVTFHAERLIFGATRARFVRGDAPWRVSDRIGREARVGAGGVGSIIQ